MSKESILSVIRHVLTFGGGYFVTSGLAGASEIEAAVGAIVTITGVVWGILNKKWNKV